MLNFRSIPLATQLSYNCDVKEGSLSEMISKGGTLHNLATTFRIDVLHTPMQVFSSMPIVVNLFNVASVSIGP